MGLFFPLKEVCNFIKLCLVYQVKNKNRAPMETSPVISIISNAYVLDLFIFLIIIGCGYIVIIFLSCLFLPWVKNRYRRLRKNIKLLEAIIKDVEEVLESVRKIDETP